MLVLKRKLARLTLVVTSLITASSLAALPVAAQVAGDTTPPPPANEAAPYSVSLPLVLSGADSVEAVDNSNVNLNPGWPAVENPFPLDYEDVITPLDPNAPADAFADALSDPTATITGITVSINPAITLRVSQYNSGISHMDDSLAWANQNAMISARAVVAGSTVYENTHLMGWGVADPWPNPSQANPTNWGDMDTRVNLIIAHGGTPVITLAEAPWWMKGQRQADGSVKLIPDARGDFEVYTYTTSFTDYRGIRYPAGYVSPSPIAARVLDSQMSNWLKLVEATARRYMAPPYNVRTFMVWNELKGYYNPSANRWDYNTSAGNITGRHAEHGYTYMYNQVYARVRQVATELGIPLTQIKIGGPYLGFKTWSDRGAGGFATTEPLLMNKPYGTYDQRDVDALKYWLANKTGAQFVAWDGGTKNREGTNLVDTYTAAEKFYDTVTWLRSLNPTSYPGATTLPVVYAEWYAFPYNSVAADQHNSIKTYGAMRFIQAGGWVTMLWGGEERPVPQLNASLYTETDVSGGGQPLLWSQSYQWIKNNFAAGTVLVQATSSSNSVGVLASAAKTLLVNKTSNTLSLTVNGTALTLNPWEVRLINTPGGGGGTGDTTAPAVSVTNPRNGSLVTHSTSVTIQASATDNVGVVKVKFFVNNVLKCTDTTAPYTCAWTVPAAIGASYSLRAQAFDAADNRGNSTITVTSK